MLGTLTVAGHSFNAYGLFATDAGIYNAPEPDVNAISIAGKNGDLLIPNNRYKNISVRYPCVILSQLASNLDVIKGYLLSNPAYVRIEDSFDTTHFRLGRFIGGTEVTPTTDGTAGAFELEFDCKPQRWLTSGETAVTITSASGTINNPTMFEALPQVKIYGSGSGAVTINGRMLTISDIDEYVVIDSDMQDSYKGALNKNDTVTLNSGGYPYLSPGNNSIARTGGVTSVEVIPRWWTL